MYKIHEILQKIKYTSHSGIQPKPRQGSVFLMREDIKLGMRAAFRHRPFMSERVAIMIGLRRKSLTGTY